VFHDFYESLAAWQQSVRLVERIYRLSVGFPEEEKSGLTATLKRAASAIPGRIADAHGQCDPAVAAKITQVTLGQLRELHTHLVVCHRLHFVSSWQLSRLRKRCYKIEQLLEAMYDDCQDQIHTQTLNQAA